MASTEASKTNMDMALDDIIAKRPRGGSRRGNGRGSARSNIVGNTRPAPAPGRSPRPSPGVERAPPGNKIIVSNLPDDVSERDVSDLFSATVGAVRSCQVNYNSNGKSTGSATVVFQQHGSAAEAFKQYNNRLIDGKKTMRIEIVVDPGRAPAAPSFADRVGEQRDTRTPENRPRRGGPAGRRGGGGGGGSGRGGPRGKAEERPKKTAEDLDAEMADYLAENNGAAA